MSEQVNNIIKRPLTQNKVHPIKTGRYLLATNEIHRLYETISRWIFSRAPGGIVYGRPRLGKTRAIQFILKALPDELGEKLPVFKFNCRHKKIASENTFFEDLLKDVGHSDPFSNKTNAKRERLYSYLIEKGQTSQENRVILIIDDAQELHEIQYGWLMDIHNELDRAEIDLTVILVGQKELLGQRSSFIKLKKAQIIGRFMVHEYKFVGIKSYDDIHACLLGYDEESEFPDNSGFSFTRYYFPEAFSNGLRLSTYTQELMDIFTEIRQKHNIRKGLEIPMQYFTRTIEYILIPVSYTHL
ncbi:ATP-binding protein, partial [Bacillus timonensis]